MPRRYIPHLPANTHDEIERQHRSVERVLAYEHQSYAIVVTTIFLTTSVVYSPYLVRHAVALMRFPAAANAEVVSPVWVVGTLPLRVPLRVVTSVIVVSLVALPRPLSIFVKR